MMRFVFSVFTRNSYLVFFLFLHLSLHSQENIPDSIPGKSTKVWFKKTIVPAALIASGFITNYSQYEQNMQNNLQKKASKNAHFYHEDYLQFMPIAELYIADLAGIKSKNHWFDQTKYLGFSNIISAGLTLGLKHLTQKTGPNKLPFSFPSGHTTFAFTNATVLYNEFSETSLLLAYSGYAFATAAGTLRMVHNEHWFSDVLLGAGIGIMAAHLVYYIEPLKNFNPFLKSDNITLTPLINDSSYGLYVAYRFR
jgi:hypothetical protein